MNKKGSKKDVCRPAGAGRVCAAERPPRERAEDFREAVLPHEPDEAAAEAGRCLSAHICTYCEVCELLCPDLCITRHPETGEILIDLDHCKGCGLCAHFCPKGAIRMVREGG